MRISAHNIALLSALVLFAAAAAPAKPGRGEETVRMVIPLHAQYSRISPPEAGIKLLEDILHRVRNVPQIAMAKQALKYQNEQNALNTQQGPTDLRLAIRPKEEAAMQANVRKQNIVAWSGGYGGVAAGAGSMPVRSTLMSDRKGFWERDAAAPGQLRSEPFAADKSGADEEARKAAGAPNPLGIWEKERGNVESIASRLSPESRERMTNAADKLYKLAQLSNAAQNAPAGSAGGALKKDESKTKSSAIMTANARYHAAPNAYQIIDDRPLVKDFRQQSNKPSRSVVAESDQLAAPAAAPAPPPAGKAAFDQIEAANKVLRADARRKKSNRVAEVALLPPNVVTGIPLVRLGSSEAQARQALAAIGSATRQVVNEWTVWSFRRPGSKDTALQVYMRNGQVEALRIFDNSLVGPEFGLMLGDDVSAVKLKFGEPAFILSEPFARSGQNYVYPISQVAFHLSRPAGSKRPAVVSLLIFNVK